MAQSYLCTFEQLFKLTNDSNENMIKKIVIPMIQRDYAQGRDNEEIKRVRDRFLNSLYEAINNEGICLDFIYGDINEKGILTLLDGQQRLTTLFLLYWYSANKCKISSEEYNFLENFTYETRYSSRDFCRELIKFHPDFNINITLSEQIINQSWFPLDWENDPTIKSMLVMIDEIDKKFKNVDNLWEKLIIEKKIKFYFLPIKNMGLTDELYIKMNSRGKPLTPFEHFKAEFEHQIETIDLKKAKEIENKIDLKWTDFLWTYGNKDGLIDSLFLNYFKYICDVIGYEENKSTQNRSYDNFDLINEYFGKNNKNRNKNLDFFEITFDCFEQYGTNIKENLFDKFISINSQDNKAKLVNINNTDLLKECLFKFYDESTGRRSREFPFSKFILLYAFIQYAINKSKITEEQMRERIRIVNNLILNSNDEMNDSETRSGGNRLPSILKQTKSIIVYGIILDNISANFNSNQLKEEIEKMEWRKLHPNMILSLNRLENHYLLNGQISVIGLENFELFDKFNELFNCDKDKISCALLTFGEYSRVEHGWRYSFGVNNEQSWKMLFHKSSADGFENTKDCLVKLLNASEKFNNDILDSIINKYINDCELNRVYDYRYYFIKYDAFRPNRYGKYWIERESKYCIRVLWTEKNVSENSFQPFLKQIDPNHLDKESNGSRLIIDGKYLYCEKDRFVLKDKDNNELGKLMIEQNANNIDTEDRIVKYLTNPLI